MFRCIQLVYQKRSNLAIMEASEYHPWNFFPPDDSDLNSIDFGASPLSISTPRLGFELHFSNADHQYQVSSPTDNGQMTKQNITSAPGLTSTSRDDQISAGSMATPLPSTRKPKSRTLRENDWNPVKHRVIELLKDKPLSEVMGAVTSEFGFQAT